MRASRGFDTVRSVGSMLPSDLLESIASGEGEFEGLRPEDYHLHGEKITEATSRAWNRLSVLWPRYRDRLSQVQDGQPTTALTRDRWLLPLFEELGFGRLQPLKQSEEIEGKVYPISHSWGVIPVHLLGAHIDLDKRTKGAVGAARQSPHSLVQDFLNSSDEHLWGFVSNGQTLRLLRDNVSMTRQAFVEFDLDGMMEGEGYWDFRLLWLLCHQSRVEGERPELCWLEKWSQKAQQDGTRALDTLRKGVEDAITSLGQGFLSYRSNDILRGKLRSGDLKTQDYYWQLLRLVYRLLFLLVSEVRDLIHLPDDTPEIRSRYESHYSITRLRDIAERKKGSRHPDLWHVVRLVFSYLSSDEGCPELGLPALGSFLWSSEALPDLEQRDISNRHLLDAIRSLALLHDPGGGFRRIDFSKLGSEELGSVYESLLELQPEIDSQTADFTLKVHAGHERKSTGSYYTPTSLINELLDSALEPVLEERVRQGWRAGREGAEQAVLSMKVCDPAAGSGHFLVAAAHRMAKRLAAIRTDEDEPSPKPYRTALRDVISRCIYGVDINPMAVELCKVSLWLEALEPGKPLSFLDHHIKCGNSLLGTTPELIDQGIPDDAFKPITGDDRKVTSALRKQNKKERQGQLSLDFGADEKLEEDYTRLARTIAEVESSSNETLMQVNQQASTYRTVTESLHYTHARLVADAWCAAFAWKKNQEMQFPLTQATLDRIKQGSEIPEVVEHEIIDLSEDYQFFHWHVEFPDVFLGTQTPGFDVVLGNPPWDQIEDVSTGVCVNRGLLEVQKHLFLHLPHYSELCSGRRNYYILFAILTRSLLSDEGYLGIVVPTGLLTDAPASKFLSALLQTRQIVSAYDFENRGNHFPCVHRQQRFILLTVCMNRKAAIAPTFGFDLDSTNDISDTFRTWSMPEEDIIAMAVDRSTIPMFSNSRDAGISGLIAKQALPMGKIQGIESGLLYNADQRSKELRVHRSDDEQTEQAVRVYEGSFFHQYDHRFATFQESSPQHVPASSKRNPAFEIVTEWGMPQTGCSRWQQVADMVPEYYVALRRQASITNERTTIATILPKSVAEGSVSVFWGRALNARTASVFVANLNSFAFDYVLRMRQSGANVNKGIYTQIPIIDCINISTNIRDKIVTCVLMLCYTSDSLRAYASDCGYSGEPYLWDEDQRFQVRCELDAIFFHLYGISRDDVSYIMDTFPIVKRRDEKVYIEYRTRNSIIEIYDRMTKTINSGNPYQSHLNPPPGNPPAAHYGTDPTGSS